MTFKYKLPKDFFSQELCGEGKVVIALWHYLKFSSFKTIGKSFTPGL